MFLEAKSGSPDIFGPLRKPQNALEATRSWEDASDYVRRIRNDTWGARVLLGLEGGNPVYGRISRPEANLLARERIAKELMEIYRKGDAKIYEGEIDLISRAVESVIPLSSQPIPQLDLDTPSERLLKKLREKREASEAHLNSKIIQLPVVNPA